ncbi:MAG: hypothetical protein RL318_350 [Fibrobacterota bacterium]|jgi:hypothetical protein
MNHDTLRGILAAQPLPSADPVAWEALRAHLEPRLAPTRPSRLRRFRWSLLAGASLLIAISGFWITRTSEVEPSWSQVHALSQWSSPGADPTWVAMEMTSP